MSGATGYANAVPWLFVFIAASAIASSRSSGPCVRSADRSLFRHQCAPHAASMARHIAVTGAAKAHAVGVEAAPMMYVAQLLGGTTEQAPVADSGDGVVL